MGEEETGARLDEIYDAHFNFVWRSIRRLGVPSAYVDDAVQDVFMVVVRRLDEFEGRSTLKTWLYGIAIRVARNHRRKAHRLAQHEELPEQLCDDRPDPEDRAAAREAHALVQRCLADLDDAKREVFVLAELEQATAPEIATALGIKLNTVYSRLRAARRAFEAAVKRERARAERLDRVPVES